MFNKTLKHFQLSKKRYMIVFVHKQCKMVQAIKCVIVGTLNQKNFSYIILYFVPLCFSLVKYTDCTYIYFSTVIYEIYLKMKTKTCITACQLL